MGDRWSLLIVRDLMVRGYRTFKEFQGSGEGIATNILADRLQRLKALRMRMRASEELLNAGYLHSGWRAMRQLLEALQRDDQLRCICGWRKCKQ